VTVKGFAKTWLKNLTLLAGIYVCFRYLGDFTSGQSAVLTGTAWIGYELYAQLKNLHTAADAFSPFSVCIHPNWHKLLFDFKLIKTDDEWRKLCEAANQMRDSEYPALLHDFIFTVIKPPGQDGLLPGLTFWDNRKVFLTKAEFQEPVIRIEYSSLFPAPQDLEKEHPFFHHPLRAVLPGFCFKSGIEGYEFGLEVEYDWWEKNKNEYKDWKIKEKPDPASGSSRLLIATLPYSEFEPYYIDINKEYDRAPKFLEKFERTRDRKLAENGWKRRPEVPDPWFGVRDPWFHVEHKYMTVSHRSI
jgi:hypothetical protein